MDFEQLRDELRTLLRPGLVGEFDHIELIEIIGTPRKGKACNVLSVVVLSEGNPAVTDREETQLIGSRISIDGFKDWSFGVARTLRPVSALDAALATYALTRDWALSGRSIQTGDLWPDSPTFAPPDGTVSVPLNTILKNNFWAGSHVFRLIDREKASFAPFFADRRRLQVLSDAVSALLPMTFAGLADLLGDVLIQVPVTILAPAIAEPRGKNLFQVNIAWRRGATPRDLRIAGRTRRDELLTGAAVVDRFQSEASLLISGKRQPVETEIWDADAGILMGATAATTILTNVHLAMHIIQHEPRIFTAPDIQGQPALERIGLTVTQLSVVGENASQDANFWLTRRQYLEEKCRLETTRDFVQYRPNPGSLNERARALADIRFLINAHGHQGVDLWDPYLTAKDLFRTLFWCSHSGAPMRGLTDGRDPPSSTQPGASATSAPAPSFGDRQKFVLNRDCGNRQGLRLEYRTRRGPKGWGFHDRFLIFPNRPEGPLAWSLGTSVNSLGLAHHILQRVPNPALVASAFEDLWTALDEIQHVIWRSW